MKLLNTDIEKLNQYINLGYIKKIKHPKYDLNLYKYTMHWTYISKGKSDWNDIMLLCRGLILDSEYNIISRSYKKFFNISEYDFDYPNDDFIVREKIDGSMINVFRYNGELIAYTLGSFCSDQAISALKLIKTQYKFDFLNVEYGYTYVFEFIAPFNKIVIDYNDRVELIFLAQFNIETGKCINISNFGNLKVPKIYNFNSIQDIINEISTSKFNNMEGYVVTFLNNDVNIKFKYSEYFKMHKAIYGLTKLSIYKILFDENGILKSDLEIITNPLSDLPDEFLSEYNKYKNELISEYNELEKSCKLTFEHIMLNNKNISKKEFAFLVINNHKNISDILFKMFDNTSYSSSIYKKIRPCGEQNVN